MSTFDKTFDYTFRKIVQTINKNNMIQVDTMLCGVGSIGTWFDGCKVTPKDFVKWFALHPSIKLNLVEDSFDQVKIVELIKKGKLVPINDILQTTEAGAKNNIQTLANKRKIKISQGIYEFNAELEANVCLVKELHKFVKKGWSLLLLDSENKLFFDNKNGFLTGFHIGFWDVDNETTNDGGSKTAQFTLTAQLTQNGTAGYNERRSYLIDETLADVLGVQKVTVKAKTKSVSNLILTVLSGCDNTSPIEGLTVDNFKVTNATDGTTEQVDIVDLGNGEYLVNSNMLAGPKTIQLYDSVMNVPVADIENTQFYQSNILAEVLV